MYDKGVLEPIYNIGKRALRGALTTDSKLAARRLKSVGGFRTGECEVQEGSFLYAYVSGFAIAVTLVLGGLLLVCARGKAKREEVFTSPARFDYQITRHHKDGPQTVTWQAASFVRHKPDEDQYPRELRRSIQEGDSDTGAEYKNKWQRFNSSCDTLVNPQTGPNPSRVSIASQSADEKHEGLIELETTGDNKTFFDPDTGEFIHLTPWKSTYDEHSVNGGDKGSVKRAVAKMFPGGVAWAAGKEVGEAVRSKTTSVEQRGGDGMHRRVPPQAGDCITGEVTHEAPSGRPQIA